MAWGGWLATHYSAVVVSKPHEKDFFKGREGTTSGQFLARRQGYIK